jgi:hypothetical protein
MNRITSYAALALVFCIAGCGDSSDTSSTEQTAEPARPPEVNARHTARLAALERRAGLVQDANDIKRLQRAYGYYLDQADWPNLLDLFTDDATAEYGQNGVYLGKESIKNFLYALNGGQAGLKVGQIIEHFQLQPVVHIDDGGMTAKGRWRSFGVIGQHQEYAEWEEGPYENEYRKENGVWKIAKIHWYETFSVPFETGWAKPKPESTAAAARRSLPPPDRPPSEVYELWPGTYLPPFHYPNPGKTAPAVKLTAVELEPAQPFAAVAERTAVLAQKVQLLEDENAIENLQRSYGYYVDKAMWTQVADLFADDGTLEIGGRGVFVGKQRVLDYLNFLGPEFPKEGRLYNHMQLQPIVHVAPDGKSAKGRWRFFAMGGEWQQSQMWGMGVYENEYVKQDDVWKIKKLHAYFRMYTPFSEGWAKTAMPNTRPEKDLPPDQPPTVVYDMYPATFQAPFHYENPVTGAPLYANDPAAYALEPPADEQALAAWLAEIERRIGLLEDTDEIENLVSIYGYYLDKNQWEEIPAIFAENGSIEIAQRGVYTGRSRVRDNLNLYGEEGVHHGFLHNHMQLQPVIHVAEDGMTAKVRSRVFSQLGTYGRTGVWHEGVYENEYVKENGVWKIAKDHLYNTVFAPYDTGWAYSEGRVPGITESNPPDAPPSVTFGIYPKVFLPPYHYDNPVTGRRATTE